MVISDACFYFCPVFLLLSIQAFIQPDFFTFGVGFNFHSVLEQVVPHIACSKSYLYGARSLFFLVETSESKNFNYVSVMYLDRSIISNLFSYAYQAFLPVFLYSLYE